MGKNRYGKSILGGGEQKFEPRYPAQLENRKIGSSKLRKWFWSHLGYRKFVEIPEYFCSHLGDSEGRKFGFLVINKV
eukprot:scaffold145_cov173-Amphora_coffeaeformis.AAC.1